ncbi:MAG: DUF4129 domain-containing protein, partial [Chloroflexota bacterium]|nr:DUF4129 domain-containing protein [Chloroflexota bacterium]
PALLEAFTNLRPIRVLRHFLTALWRRLTKLTGMVAERIPRRLSLRRARQKSSKERFRFFRLGALSAQERILYYYLSILRRANQQGFPRQSNQTPDEYGTILSPQLPQAQQEMSLLTRAFVEARYSHHNFDQEHERRVRADWQQVKAALRALKQKQEDDVPSGTGEESATQTQKPRDGHPS